MSAPGVPSAPIASPIASPIAPPVAAPVDPHSADFGKAPLAAADQLFIVEAVIVIVLCKALSWVLNKIKQPSVIAEVISGIILGPTIMGRVPGFTKNIFPPQALPIFNVIANIGLIFFMNLIGLELDFELMVAEWKRTAVISVATMAIPFAVSIGSSYAVWQTIDRHYAAKNQTFGTYLLFMGVAMCVTAFPVLARIVKEKHLFKTRLGVTTLATAAWADVAAWTLLALSISLIGGGSKYNILWTFLSLIAFAIIMFGPVRWLLRKVLIRKGEPIAVTPSVFAALIVATLISSWITAYVGLHSIFGAFIFGIILPRDGGFCVHLAEKYEDFVTAFFLPLYFTASGLRTQLGLLSDFNTWGLLLLLVSVAIITKIGSGLFAARITGLGWRESFTLGVLMNTKGLVELIVLNIGLDNKLITPTTFSMMVVLALVTTFITSPIVHFAYPYSRIVEFENQTPGKTVFVAAIRDKISVASIVSVFNLITSGRPKRYRMRVVRTMALQDRPSAYMSKSHTDEVLESFDDLAKVLNMRVKTIPLTYNDTDSQKIEQLATASQSHSANFFFVTRKISTFEDKQASTRFRLGGSFIKKLFNYKSFQGNLAVLFDRGMPTSIDTATFIYSGSEHDVQAARLAKGIMHTPGAHLNVIYAINPESHPDTAITKPDEIKDPVLAALFRKVRSATISLMVAYDTDLTTAVLNHLNSLEEPGVVICGCDSLSLDEISPQGVNYREVIVSSLASVLCVSKGKKSKRAQPKKSKDSTANGNAESIETTMDSTNATPMSQVHELDAGEHAEDDADRGEQRDEPTDTESTDDSDLSDSGESTDDENESSSSPSSSGV